MRRLALVRLRSLGFMCTTSLRDIRKVIVQVLHGPVAHLLWIPRFPSHFFFLYRIHAHLSCLGVSSALL